MKQLSYVGFAVLAFGFTSCQDKPGACFNPDKETVAVNTPVSVSAACSENSKTFYWAATDQNEEDLDESVVTMEGDGYGSTETFTFSQPGTYILHLCVSRGLFGDSTERIVVVTDEDTEVPTK